MEKIAIITGSNGSMGNALVVELTKRGIRCVCVDKDGDQNENFFRCDFSKQTEIQNLVKTLTSKFGKIDYLFNIAGIGIYKDIDELTVEQWNDSLTINLIAPFILSKGLLPLLKKSDEGVILSFGSGMGVEPTAGRSAYCASKFGLRGFSLTLSKELKGSNIKVVHLTLGSVMTGFGTGGLELRKKLAQSGKKYLSVEWVISRVMEILESPDKKDEYVFYPKGYSSQSLIARLSNRSIDLLKIVA